MKGTHLYVIELRTSHTTLRGQNASKYAYEGDFYETEILWTMMLTLTVIFSSSLETLKKKPLKNPCRVFFGANAYAYASLCQIFKQN